MTYSQDPQDKQDYQVVVTGDVVASGTAAILPATGVTLSAVATTSTTARVRVSGLTVLTKYVLTIHVVGASGQEWDNSCTIMCESR